MILILLSAARRQELLNINFAKIFSGLNKTLDNKDSSQKEESSTEVLEQIKYISFIASFSLNISPQNHIQANEDEELCSQLQFRRHESGDPGVSGDSPLCKSRLEFC